MTSWQSRYHPLYSKLKSEYDAHVIEWFTRIEERILSAPYAYKLLKHELCKFRRYKGGKPRILYVLSTECPEMWEQVWGQRPKDNEVMFVFLDLKSDETYDEALKLLRSNRLI